MKIVISAATILATAATISCSKSASSSQASELKMNQPASLSETTLYYIGEAITTPVGGSVTRYPYLIERTTNPAAKTIVEHVVSFDSRNNKYAQYDSQLDITGNHAVMTESTGVVTGEGELTGERWKWDFFKAEFKVAGQPMRIVDFNVFTPVRIMGHKDFYMTNPSTGVETLFRQEDLVAAVVSETEFRAKKSELMR